MSENSYWAYWTKKHGSKLLNTLLNLSVKVNGTENQHSGWSQRLLSWTLETWNRRSRSKEEPTLLDSRSNHPYNSLEPSHVLEFKVNHNQRSWRVDFSGYRYTSSYLLFDDIIYNVYTCCWPTNMKLTIELKYIERNTFTNGITLPQFSFVFTQLLSTSFIPKLIRELKD